MHIYQNSFVTWNFGTGSAMSVLLLLFLLVITGGYLRIANRGAQDA
jgi:multiple sugar transport system permease protein